MLRYSVRSASLKLPPALVTTKKWGPRKNWVKESKLPIDPKERPFIWDNTNKVAVKDKEMGIELVDVKHNKVMETIEKSLGRFRRQFSVRYRNKEALENTYYKAIKAMDNAYQHSNDGIHPGFIQEANARQGPLMTNAQTLTFYMNCSVLYEIQLVGREGECEWIGDFSKGALITDPRELTLLAIDGRFSRIGYKGLRYLKGQKKIRYLNMANGIFWNDHCMSRLHMLENSLEYLDISGTDVTINGLGYLRMLKHLKWLNLSGMTKQTDFERYAALISEILPPKCQVIYNEDEDSAKDRLSSGSNDSKILTRKDVEEMFELPKLGESVTEKGSSARKRRKQMMYDYNGLGEKERLRAAVYAKAAERLPPLI